jgi:Sulfite exporter TauE/SafE
MDPLLSLSGFFVGLLVGQTGMGGGALMTPLLVLVFGMHPATAVGSDLLYASATKSVGTLVHGLGQTVNWRIVRRLAAGSVPATAITLLLISQLDLNSRRGDQVISSILGVMLLLTALSLLFRRLFITLVGQSARQSLPPTGCHMDHTHGCWIRRACDDFLGGRGRGTLVARFGELAVADGAAGRLDPWDHLGQLSGGPYARLGLAVHSRRYAGGSRWPNVGSSPDQWSEKNSVLRSTTISSKSRLTTRRRESPLALNAPMPSPWRTRSFAGIPIEIEVPSDGFADRL